MKVERGMRAWWLWAALGGRVCAGRLLLHAQ